MSRTYSNKENKKHKSPKIKFQEYLYDLSEPQGNIYRDSSSLYDLELLDDTYTIKQELRNLANRMRRRYI